MGERVTIKKYSNRRLYHTGERRYVNLDDVARMVREDQDFVVVDEVTGKDITRQILAQVVLEQTKDYEPVFPQEFLRLVIKQRSGIQGWHDLVRQIVPQPFPSPFPEGWPDPFGIFGRKPTDAPPAPAPEPEPAPEPVAPSPDLREELAALKAQLDALAKSVSRPPRGRPKKRA